MFFTGEPLLSPLARPVLEGIPGHDPGRYTTTLVPAGLPSPGDLPWLAVTSLDRVKVSLHYFSDATIASIAAGKPGDIQRIKAGIQAAVKVIPVARESLRPGSAHGYAREQRTNRLSQPGLGRASGSSPWTPSRSRSSTPASAAITSASAPTAPSRLSALRGSGRFAWTPPAPSRPACYGPTCASTSRAPLPIRPA